MSDPVGSDGIREDPTAFEKIRLSVCVKSKIRFVEVAFLSNAVNKQIVTKGETFLRSEEIVR